MGSRSAPATAGAAGTRNDRRGRQPAGWETAERSPTNQPRRRGSLSLSRTIPGSGLLFLFILFCLLCFSFGLSTSVFWEKRLRKNVGIVAEIFVLFCSLFCCTSSSTLRPAHPPYPALTTGSSETPVGEGETRISTHQFPREWDVST